jgi:hypothetical protein
MTAEELSDRFDISLTAARIRLQELERAKRKRLGIRRPLPSSVVEYLQDAKKKGYRITSLD